MDFCNLLSSVSCVKNFTVSSDNFTGATLASKTPMKHAVAYLKMLFNVPYFVPQCSAGTFTVFCFNVELRTPPPCFCVSLLRSSLRLSHYLLLCLPAKNASYFTRISPSSALSPIPKNVRRRTRLTSEYFKEVTAEIDIGFWDCC